MKLRIQKGDCVAVAMVILLAVMTAFFYLPRPGGDATVEIYQSGRMVKRMKLQEDGSVTLGGAYTNVVTVRDGAVSISESDCPGKDCVHSGAVRSAGRSLVCLPNGVEVRVVGKQSDVDFVVG